MRKFNSYFNEFIEVFFNLNQISLYAVLFIIIWYSFFFLEYFRLEKVNQNGEKKVCVTKSTANDSDTTYLPADESENTMEID